MPKRKSRKYSFFSECIDSKMGKQWLSVFDWLFDESKFENWEKKRKDQYTKAIKDIKGFDLHSYYCKTDKIPTRANKFTIHMSIPYGQSVSLIKHIRNGIAHSHAKRRSIRGILFIELTDYYKKDRTAFILVPESIVFELKRIYDSMS